MLRYKLPFCVLGIAIALFAGVARLPAQQSSAKPEWLEKALKPAQPPNTVQFPSVSEPTLPANNSHVGGPVTPASSFNQTYEQALSKARQDCKALWSDRAFEVLRNKVPIPLDLDQDKPTWSMLTNTERMRPKQKALAELVMRTLEQCRAAYAPVYSMLPPQVKTMIKEGLERKQDALIAELSLGKVTFGEYNIAVNEMSGEFLRALSGLQKAPQAPTSSTEPYEILGKATAECKALWSSNTFDTLRKKIPLGDEKPSLPMLTNKEHLHPKDRPLADLAIKTLETCRAAVAPGYAMLPPQTGALKDRIDRKQDTLIAQLYTGKITFGEYNAKMARLYEESASVLSGIPQSDQFKPSNRASPENTTPNTGPVLSPIPTQAPQPTKPELGASPARRVALVIGNSNYSNLPKLLNPENDARSIKDSLQHIGFVTKLVLDASEQDMRREVRKFASESDKTDIALVFYAGHGAQVNGENYLLPVDMDVPRIEADIQLTGFKVDDLINSIRSNTKIVFLDACRDNPALFRNLVKGRGAPPLGLAPAIAAKLDPGKPGGGIFIAYATDSGSVAQDGEGRHSPFTQALLRNLQKSISIDDMFSLVTKEVRLITKNTQRPYKYASLENIVCLTGNCQGAPSLTVTIDPVEQAERSESQDFQIALNTKNPDALEAFLQKYPDSSKGTEVLESISTLKRSDFTEWTIYELGNQQFPWSMQLSSIRQFGNRVAVRLRFTPDPAVALAPGVEMHDVAYGEQVAVYDCDQSIMAVSENTLYNRSGEVLHHFKWADPEYLNLSIGTAVTPGTIAITALNLVCYDDLRTPLLGKKRLAAMNFAYLSSTVDGDGDIFYAPIVPGVSADEIRDVVVIIRARQDYNIKRPDGSFADQIPKYHTEVDRVRLKCSSNGFAFTKSEYFDQSNNLVFVNNLIHTPATEPSTAIQWKSFIENSPFALLQRIVCHSEFGGVGVVVAQNGTSIKVVRVIDKTPAQKGGVKVNDVITHLDDQPVDVLNLNQVVEKIRGATNTKIKIRLAREGQEVPIELSLSREIIREPNVQGQIQQ